MTRREFITLIGSTAVAWPLAAYAQQPMRVIGYLSGGAPGPFATNVVAFQEGLKDAGYIEGQRMSSRREFITLIGGAAAAWPLTARAQQAAKIARIGYLGLASASWHTPRVNAFRAGLRALGYAEGKDFVIEFRWAEGRYDQLPVLAAELVRLNVDVIVTHTVPGAIAAKQATSRIPIIITAASDLLAFGLVESLARPGGNLTGLSFFNAELVAKRLELLKELAPSLTKAAVLLNADNLSGNQLILRALEPTAKALKVELLTFEARGPGDFDGVFAAMLSQRIGAAVLHEDPMLNANTKAIVDIIAKHHLPTCGFPEFAAAGGLMAYGINLPEMDWRAAAFVDKILKGAKPTDLPVERAMKFTTIVNLRTARAMGIEVPTSILLRADEVIE
jgi:putative ABC transport system substrate-binding protein